MLGAGGKSSVADSVFAAPAGTPRFLATWRDSGERPAYRVEGCDRLLIVSRPADGLLFGWRIGADSTVSTGVAAGSAEAAIGRKLLSATETQEVGRTERVLVPEADDGTAKDGIRACVSIVWQDARIRVLLAHCRPASVPEFSDKESDRSASLAVTLTQAVRAEIERNRASMKMAIGMLDAVSMAGVVLDRHGYVLGQSLRMTRLLNDGRLLKISNRRLVCAVPSQAEAFNAAVNAVSCESDSASKHGVFVISNDRHSVPIDLRTLPPSDDILRQAPALVAVARIAPQKNNEFNVAILKQIFGLTKAEAEIALAIARGRTVKRIAEYRGVARGTLRSQLKQVFMKVGVSRQADLVIKIHDRLGTLGYESGDDPVTGI